MHVEAKEKKKINKKTKQIKNKKNPKHYGNFESAKSVEHARNGGLQKAEKDQQNILNYQQCPSRRRPYVCVRAYVIIAPRLKKKKKKYCIANSFFFFSLLITLFIYSYYLLQKYLFSLHFLSLGKE